MILLVPALGAAEREPATEVRDARPGVAPPIAAAPVPGENARCADLTDGICRDVWSQANRGQMNAPDGKINMGKSRKSNLEQTYIDDLNALIDSVHRMPEDLRAKVAPLASDLKKALAAERDDKAFYRKLSRLVTRYNEIAEDVATARTHQTHPELKDIKPQDRTVQQSILFQRDFDRLSGEVLDAKYANHPNWKRVEGLFSRVKEDLAAEIKALPISEEAKVARLKILNDVQLSLPYNDGERLVSDPACGSSMHNAFYHPSYRKFTVCAGFFNAIQSEMGLYGVVAHEIAHSVDPVSYGHEMCWHGPTMQRLSRLKQQTAAPYSCAEWSRTTAELMRSRESVQLPSLDPLDKVSACLSPKDGLKEFTAANVVPVIQTFVRSNISSHATHRSFLKLTTSVDYKDGKQIQNELHRRPDLLEAANNGNRQIKATNRYPSTTEIFNQALECARITKDGREIGINDASQEERNLVLTKAIEQTRDISQVAHNNMASYCGNNCGFLTNHGLSTNPQENFADWLAGRALSRAAARKTDLGERRMSLAFAMVDFCDKPNILTDAQDLAVAEKKFSLAPHNDQRVRRLAIFNRKNSELARCEITDDERGYGKCEP